MSINITQDQNKAESKEDNFEKMKELLRQIAYPRRGTEEEKMDIFKAGELIQSVFPLYFFQSDD